MTSSMELILRDFSDVMRCRHRQSKHNKFSIPPIVPSGAVTSLDVRNIDPTTVELSWGPVVAREQNGIILSYDIYYRQNDSMSSNYMMIANVTEMVCSYLQN